MQLVIAGLIALQLLECGAEASDFLTGAAEFDPGLGAYFGEIEAFFNSPATHDLKLQICEIGRRLWQRAYVDGNGGNIAVTAGDVEIIRGGEISTITFSNGDLLQCEGFSLAIADVALDR